MAKAGIRRENSRFVLLPSMIAALNDQNLVEDFNNVAVQAYMVARSNARVILQQYIL